MEVEMQGEQLGFMHMGQDDILFMADTQFIMTIEFCQIGHGGKSQNISMKLMS